MSNQLKAAKGDTDSAQGRTARQLAYWKRTLAGLPEQLQLPADRPRPKASSGEGASVSFRVDAGLHGRLLGLAEEADASLFMALHAGVAALLTRLGAGTDIPIGSVVVGWRFGAAEEESGFFVNALVLRTDTSGNPCFRELLARVRAADLHAYANQTLPFGRLVEELNPARSAARHPLFQVVLAFENMPDASLGLSGLAVSPRPSGDGAAMFDLVFSLRERRDADGCPRGLDGRIEYACDLFDRSTAEALALSLGQVLEAAAADAGQPIGEFDLLWPEGRWQILGEWDDAALEVPKGLVPELFETPPSHRPQAPLSLVDEPPGYGELSEQVNRLSDMPAGDRVGIPFGLGVAALGGHDREFAGDAESEALVPSLP